MSIRDIARVTVVTPEPDKRSRKPSVLNARKVRARLLTISPAIPRDSHGRPCM